MRCKPPKHKSVHPRLMARRSRAEQRAVKAAARPPAIARPVVGKETKAAKLDKRKAALPPAKAWPCNRIKAPVRLRRRRLRRGSRRSRGVRHWPSPAAVDRAAENRAA